MTPKRPKFNLDAPESGWRRGQIRLNRPQDPGRPDPGFAGLLSPEGMAYEDMGVLPKPGRTRDGVLRMYADYESPGAGYEHRYILIAGEKAPVVAQRYTSHPVLPWEAAPVVPASKGIQAPQVPKLEVPHWRDDFGSRCPDQCYGEFRYSGLLEPATLYLRWRWSDPWQGHVILDGGIPFAAVQPGCVWSPDLLGAVNIPHGDLDRAKETLTILGLAWLKAHLEGALWSS